MKRVRVPRLIESSDELWRLLTEIKKLDNHTFIACLLGAFVGARFSELGTVTIKDLRKTEIHLGTQIHLGTGRNVPLINRIQPYIKEFCDNQPDHTKNLLERLDGSFLRLLEANQIVNEAARRLNLKNIAVTSFRKSFGHRLCKLLKSEYQALYVMGFERNRATNLYTMFDLEKGGWK